MSSLVVGVRFADKEGLGRRYAVKIWNVAIGVRVKYTYAILLVKTVPRNWEAPS